MRFHHHVRSMRCIWQSVCCSSDTARFCLDSLAFRRINHRIEALLKVDANLRHAQSAGCMQITHHGATPHLSIDERSSCCKSTCVSVYSIHTFLHWTLHFLSLSVNALLDAPGVIDHCQWSCNKSCESSNGPIFHGLCEQLQLNWRLWRSEDHHIVPPE